MEPQTDLQAAVASLLGTYADYLQTLGEALELYCSTVPPSSSFPLVEGLPDSPPRREAPALPPELIHRIIQLPSPPDQIYTERLAVLCACSLALRSWRDIAQKELFRLVAIEGQQQLASLLKPFKEVEGGRQLANWVQELSTGGTPRKALPAQMAEQITLDCPNLRTLHLAYVEELSLSSSVKHRGSLQQLCIEHSTIRVPRCGDAQICPTIRYLRLHGCSLVGQSTPSVEWPLGQRPNVRALALSAGLRVPPVQHQGPRLVSDPRTWYIIAPTERLYNLFSSFSPSFQILSVDSAHTKFFEPQQDLAQIPLSFIKALELTPAESTEPQYPFNLAFPPTAASSLKTLRIPATPAVFDHLRIKLLDQTQGII